MRSMKCFAIVMLILASYSVAFNLKNPVRIARTSAYGMKMVESNHFASYLQDLVQPHQTTIFASTHIQAAGDAVSVYSKIDKSGFIGFFATYIELAIDFFHSIFSNLGIQNAYGPAIILFTILIRFATIPLTSQQLASTMKMQKLTPLQQKIQAKFADNEEMKNKMLAKLFQSAKVNPLAGCLPALIQLPVFISLYRAIINLVAENKLDEPFLWIPDLEGPVYTKPPDQALNWISSITSGQPELGWSDTIAFLSLPVMLYVSQVIAQKVLQPPRPDPSKPLTEQEQTTQTILTVVPLLSSFFCLNAPASLSVYWLTNSISATLATVAVRNTMKIDPFPAEVDEIMAVVDGPMKKLADSDPTPFASTNENKRSKAVGFANGNRIEVSLQDDIRMDNNEANVSPAAPIDLISETSVAEPPAIDASNSSMSKKKKRSRG